MTRATFKSDRHAALDAAFPRDTSTYRLHAQGYRPRPAPKPPALVRLWRALTTRAEPEHRRAFLNDADRGL